MVSRDGGFFFEEATRVLMVCFYRVLCKMVDCTEAEVLLCIQSTPKLHTFHLVSRSCTSFYIDKMLLSIVTFFSKVCCVCVHVCCHIILDVMMRVRMRTCVVPLSQSSSRDLLYVKCLCVLPYYMLNVGVCVVSLSRHSCPLRDIYIPEMKNV